MAPWSLTLRVEAIRVWARLWRRTPYQLPHESRNSKRTPDWVRKEKSQNSNFELSVRSQRAVQRRLQSQKRLKLYRTFRREVCSGKSSLRGKHTFKNGKQGLSKQGTWPTSKQQWVPWRPIPQTHRGKYLALSTWTVTNSEWTPRVGRQLNWNSHLTDKMPNT